MEMTIPRIKINVSAVQNALPTILGVGVLGALLVGAFWFGYKGSSYPSQTISVSGSAQEDKGNKLATFTAGLRSINDKKVVAVEDINKKSKIIIDAIKNSGVDEKDVKTSYFNVYQNSNWDSNSQQTKYTDWTASMSIDIKLRDISKASDFAGLLASLDTSDVNGPNFSLDTDQAKDTDLLKKALEDAHDKALKLAEASGRKLGKLISVNENDYGGSSAPMYDTSGKTGMGGGGSPDLTGGTTTVVKSVNATYELK